MLLIKNKGHNELDDPSFTNPLIYKQVNSHQSVPDLYKEKIASEILVEQEKLDTHVKQFRDQLDDALNKVNTSNYEIKPRATYLNKAWSHMNMPSNKSVSVWDTGFNMDMLRFIGHRSVAFPDQFVLKLKETYFAQATSRITNVKKRKLENEISNRFIINATQLKLVKRKVKNKKKSQR